MRRPESGHRLPVAAAALGLLLAAGAGAAEEPISFSRDIRPLLSDRCFRCHGFDEETREAGLGLHRADQATKDLGGYRAIAPGEPGASEIIARVLSEDPDDVMPPPSANKPRFSESEVELLRRWIEQGAPYETHWAFEKPVRPSIPGDFEGHPIDYWIDRRLVESEIPVNGPADLDTLIRRLSFDLRGIPPTPEERARFLEESAEDESEAWIRLVDRFLDSPHYGVKWAREWLDLARYADTNGYEKDRPRSIWPWRDWVVDALNTDMPYDRFTIEQLAGDMLPDAGVSQRIATGFHRNTMLNEEGGIDPLEFRYHAMVDRVATTGTVWLGLTTGCAQCHTHKFDPITHTDYFSLMALLDNTEEPSIAVPVPEVAKRREAVQAQIDETFDEAIAKIEEERFEAWRKRRLSERPEWTTVRPVSMESNLPMLELEEDGAVYASGDFTKRDFFELVFDLSGVEGPVTAIRLEALPDERLPGGGPGAAYYEGRNGDFFLSEVAARVDGDDVAFSSASVSFGKISVGSGTAEGGNVIDGNGSTGWSTATQQGEANELVLALAEPIDSKGSLEVDLLFERHFVAALGKFRISVTGSRDHLVADSSGLPDPRRAGDREMREAFVMRDPAFEATRKQVENLRRRLPELPTTLVMRERPPENPRPTHRHHRGEYLSPREEVPPAVPDVFDPIPETEPANRLGFARWLVSERNPLGARVAVNRAWHSFFGAGFVKTPGDFGYQSELPSHPELLDWLSVEWVERGWSMKELHKIIVTSEAYRRSSRVRSEQLETDPTNRLLARGPRFRLTGEMIRDTLLRASGLLSDKQGGPGVYPPQPASVVELAYGRASWKPSEGEDRYRRSLYTFAKRTAPFAAYMTFDGTSGEVCLARRERSNTPLQALTLLNDPMFAEAAEALARDLAAGGGEPESVVRRMFLRVLSRPPSDEETAWILEYFETQRERLVADELDPGTLLADPSGATPELAAWKMVARALFNLSETITKG